MKRFRVASIALLLSTFWRSPLPAQVSCANPDNLCTGDPCVTGVLLVESPCVVDFGSRTLIVGNTLSTPNGGVLSLEAGAIEVDGRIVAKGQNGGSVSLVSDSTLETTTGINATGRLTPGAISLSAAGAVEVGGELTSGSPTASGGTVTIVSTGGEVATSKRGKINVRSRKADTGGTVAVAAAGNVVVGGKVTADGGAGGMITVSSDSGDVHILKKTRARGKATNGGQIALSAGSAAGEVRILDKVESPGKVDGGSVLVTGETVTVEDKVRARGLRGVGGSVTVTAENLADVADDLDVRGREGGGTIAVGVIGGSAATIIARDAADFRARTSRQTGGTIQLASTGSVDIGVGVDLEARSGDTGGTVEVGAAIDLAVGNNADFNVRGDVGGEIRLSAGNDMVLAGDFDARRNGVVEALAGCDLTVSSDVRVGAGGCIGLSAGCTLDTSGADFDVLPGPSCP